MRKHIRIAIMGAKQAGKTVLLTAIDGYLKYLSDNVKKLNGWRVDEYYRSEVADGGDGFKEFPVSKYHESYSKDPPEWPQSTTHPARLCCSLTLSKDVDAPKNSLVGRVLAFCGRCDKAERRLTIEFLDIPGERMTDIATMQGRTFQEWSEKVFRIDRNTDIPSLSTRFDEYVEEAEKIAGDGSLDSDKKKEQICAKYKDVAAAHIIACSPFITPSDIQLDEDDKDGADSTRIDDDNDDDTRKTPEDKRAKELEELAKKLNDVDFAPLPQKFFGGTHTDLVSSFEKAYDVYRRKKEGLFNWFSKVDQIYFLVDVLGILEHGKGRYEGVRSQIDLAFPQKGSWLHWLWNGICGRNVSRICMVATQVDRTNIDHNEGNIKKLLDCLFERVNHCSRGMEKETLLCAAVQSASTVGEDGDKVVGKFTYGAGSVNAMEVPDKFDFSKPPSKPYKWAKPLPRFRPDSEIPRHYKLDELLMRMLGVCDGEKRK